MSDATQAFLSKLRSIDALEAHAFECLSPMARGYYAGGSRDEITLRQNRRAWDEIELWYRVLVDVAERNTQTSVVGHEIAAPILLAPTAFHGLAHPDAECASVRAASSFGTIACVSTLSNVSLERAAAASSRALWFQLYVYRDRGVTKSLIERAEAAGYRAIVLTVDAAEIGTREADQDLGFHLPPPLTMGNFQDAGRAMLGPARDDSALSQYVRTLLDPSLTWSDVSWLKQQTKLPVVIKGLVRADDARQAVDAGASAVIVSNLGGRQLDTAPATATSLPYVVDAIRDEVDILVDGGIRRGTDIIKALALGAKAVLIGRPALWGLACAGEAGVLHALRLLHAELSEAMALCGCPRIETISSDLLVP